MSVITMITDFGERDAYVASMKGAILTLNPKAQIVDICHNVEAGNIREASFLLTSSYRYFPQGTIHVVVVDPGVGGRRKILCAKSNRGYFIAPDNGILTSVLKHEKVFSVRELENHRYFLDSVSPTFHGRDKMAPVAAYLSKKNIFSQLGKRLMSHKKISWPPLKIQKSSITGCVIHVDRFGNIITNIARRHLKRYGRMPKCLSLRSKSVHRWSAFYGEVPKGALTALFSSSGFVEIAANQASAQKKLKMKIGDPVVLRW